MSEQVQEPTQAAPPMNDLSSRMQQDFFGDNPVQAPTPEPEPTPEPTPEPMPEPAKPEPDEVITPQDWLKRELDIEDIAILKQEREELKKLKENPNQAFSWKNNDSQKLAEYINEGKVDDLYKFLHTQSQVKRLSSSDVTDKNIAAELVKFGIKNETPSLTDEDVDFLFNEKYATPPKPVQAADELDDEYSLRVSDWQTKVSSIERRLMIEAKMNQPKLANLLTDLKLPDIQREAPQPSKEELEQISAMQTSFLEKAAASINAFSGFTANVKDKDVDYKVSYTPSNEEKKLLNEVMQSFAKTNFDANIIFADRWLNQDGSINETQVTEDLSRVFMGKNADAKMASEAANQRLELYLKGKKNINLNGGINGSAPPPSNGETRSEKLQREFFGG